MFVRTREYIKNILLPGPDVNLTQTEDIRNRLLVARLPSLPQPLLKLLTLCQSDDTGIAELAELIAKDPAMSARLVSVANSAAYHHGDQPLSLMQSAQQLGSDMIKVLAISESVFQTFNAFSKIGGVDLRPFWKHCLRLAITTKDLAHRLAPALLEEAYLAGLLHDVGRLALLVASPQNYLGTFQRIDLTTLCQDELGQLKISHAEAGAWLAGQWRLSPALVESILYHHADRDRIGSTHTLTRLLHLAHRLCDLPQDSIVLPDEFPCEFDLDADELISVLQHTHTHTLQTARDLGIDISSPAPATPAQAPAQPADPAQTQLALEVRNRNLLAQMCTFLAKQPDTPKTLAGVLDHVQALLQLDQVLIMLLDDAMAHLTLAAHRTEPNQHRPLTLAVSDSDLLTHCVQHLQIGLSEPTSDKGHSLRASLKADRVACLPLGAGSRCVGVLIAIVSAARWQHVQSQASLLQAFGLQVGEQIALRQHAETQQEATKNALDKQQLDAKKLVHEVNSPLSVIRNYVDQIADKLGHHEPLSTKLAAVQEEITRVTHIVDSFADQQTAHAFQSQDLGSVTRELVQVLKDSRYLPSTLDILCELPNTPLPFFGSADMLKQILINLIKNAHACMPNGGRIVIQDKGQTQLNARVFTRFALTDQGPGIAATNQSQLFNPMRPATGSERVGLGLNIVNDLLQQMGGRINFTSTAEGTTFLIDLPVSPPA